MFENKVINGCDYATRFIMSWVKVGGRLVRGKDYDDFRDWLKSMGLSNEDVSDILFLASNGKLELQESAKRFLKENSNPK